MAVSTLSVLINLSITMHVTGAIDLTPLYSYQVPICSLTAQGIPSSSLLGY
jgi:hypothetical protein